MQRVGEAPPQEVGGVARPDALLPYPKPITVKPGSFAVLSDLNPDLGRDLACEPWAGEEWQVAEGGAPDAGSDNPVRRVSSWCPVTMPAPRPG